MVNDDAVRFRAYLIWEREGRPHGRHLDHWLQAHWELLSERTDTAAAASTPASQDTETAAKPKRAPRKRAAPTAAEAADAASPAKKTRTRSKTGEPKAGAESAVAPAAKKTAGRAKTGGSKAKTAADKTGSPVADTAKPKRSRKTTAKPPARDEG